ncbi:MAG: amidase [Hyphomicrobiaceae bacterium]|nr:amidase [Hyphomicrobiaceae bacterium]
MSPVWREKTLEDIGRALRAGELSSCELLDGACDAHKSYGETLSAYRTWNDDHARTQAEAADEAFRAGRDGGPLQGIPTSVKDLFGVSYLDTYAGSPNPLPAEWSREGPVVRAVLDQGAVVTGKTHMVEFAFGGLGTNAHWLVPRNPWDAENYRVAGGSSSGAGVSLIEGSALLALGSDTAGSVRVPASMTGTVGLKVTAARWPLDGIVPLSPTLDTPGVLTRCVADAALAFEVIDAFCAGREAQTPAKAAAIGDIKIGICENHFFSDCPADIADVIHTAIGELESAGAQVAAFDLPETEDAFDLFCKGSVVAWELQAYLKDRLPGWAETLDPIITLRLAGAADLEKDEITRRRSRMAELSGSAEERLARVDVLVSPTVPITAPKVEEVSELKSYSAANLAALRNTCIANLLGLCAITLPVGLDRAGIPVGLQCIAGPGQEEKLLSIALAFERILGTPRKRLGKPPLGV